MSGTEQSGVHAFCHDCDWYATPEEHEYADVMTAAEAHTTFKYGHTATVGASDETVKMAQDRSLQPGTEADRDV